MKKILFITHDASLSGAPLVLLYFMQWIKISKPDYKLDIAFVLGGPMESEFNEITERQYYLNPKQKYQKSFKKYLKKMLRIKSRDIFKTIAENDYDIIYSNTVVSAGYGDKIKGFSEYSKHIVHVHELQTIIKTLTPNFNKITYRIDHIIAASDQVRKNLIKNWNANKDAVSVIYECATIAKTNNQNFSESFVVGACGLSYWRKGNDVFLQVARYIFKNKPDIDIKFIWVGNEFKDKEIIDADIQKLGLESKVIFVGETSDTAKYFNDFNVFLMTSREDPFPLVCIEVANMEKPIICFDGASGTSEIIKNGGGYVVPYLDIEEMGEKIIYYYKNRSSLIEDGKKAKKLFEKFSPENMCPKYFEIIESV